MSHPLENTWLKLNRADKHLHELKRKMDGFAYREPYRMVRHELPEDGYYVYDFRFLRMPPRRWGIILGDIAHNMRSALDHLAWSLAGLTTKSPARSTGFPIFPKPPHAGNQKSFDKMIRQMPGPAQKEIKALQPHHDGILADKHPLAVLAFMSNRDKHQLLVPIATVVNAPVRNIPGGSIHRLNARHIRVQVPISADPEVNFEPDFTFQITFGVPAFYPNGVDLFRLQDIGKFIREDTLPRFAGFFPPP
ncbi:MAG: hypothetical protein IH872_08700 [Chloroflexi bacterium]|nr:hypothetical protein [Chloroflexota bacterium]